MVSKTKNKLGKKIQKMRNERGFSQEIFAQKAGIPLTSFSKIEQGGIKNPSVYVAEKIAKTLKISIEKLIK